MNTSKENATERPWVSIRKVLTPNQNRRIFSRRYYAIERRVILG